MLQRLVQELFKRTKRAAFKAALLIWFVEHGGCPTDDIPKLSKRT